MRYTWDNGVHSYPTGLGVCEYTGCWYAAKWNVCAGARDERESGYGWVYVWNKRACAMHEPMIAAEAETIMEMSHDWKKADA